MNTTKRMQAWRRERRVLARVSRAAWRFKQAERERAWALGSARAQGVSIRVLAAAVGLSPARVHQIVTGADLDALDATLGELPSAGWPAPEDPGTSEDTELDGRDLIATACATRSNGASLQTGGGQALAGAGDDQLADDSNQLEAVSGSGVTWTAHRSGPNTS